MINSLFRKIKNYIINSTLDYKKSDLYFIRISNLFFKITKKSHRFKLSNLGDNLPKYFVQEFNNENKKYLGYRRQGLMAFGNGIILRG